MLTPQGVNLYQYFLFYCLTERAMLDWQGDAVATYDRCAHAAVFHAAGW